MELNDLEKTLQPLFDYWKGSLDMDFGDFINTQDESYIMNLINEIQ
jgi:sulfite reductase (ferredoxin)